MKFDEMPKHFEPAVDIVNEQVGRIKRLVDTSTKCHHLDVPESLTEDIEKVCDILKIPVHVVRDGLITYGPSYRQLYEYELAR